MESPTTTTTTAAAASTTVAGLTAKLVDSTCLDMVFCMDATGSMGSYIASAQATIHTIVQSIVAAEKADVRFALIAYRDHPPQDSSFVTKPFPFTNSVAAMRKNLDTLSANGGGDGPEAVVDSLHGALHLDYRPEATKVCILIADAPPHGLDTNGDGFPEGCPCGYDPITVCRDMAQAAITLYCIGCEPSIAPYRQFFSAMAHITGGQYIPLNNAAVLSNVIVGGVREEMCLERLMTDVHAELLSSGKDLSEEEQAKHVWSKMREKNVKTKQLKMGSAAIPKPSDEAVRYSKAASLAAVRSEFTADPSSSGAPGGAMRSGPMMMDMCAAPSLSKKKASFGFSLFGSSASKPESAVPMPMAAAMPSSAPVEAAGDYNLAEAEDISLEQCSRLVTKTAARYAKK